MDLLRRVAAAALAGSVLAGCGPSADEDALALCRQVAEQRTAVDQLAARVPDSSDFDQISMVLMEVYDLTEFLQDWTYVATDELNRPVREAARAALASTGMYSDGSNPITGRELTSNLASAGRNWDRLESACASLAG
jgi:hypothetical protein